MKANTTVSNRSRVSKLHRQRKANQRTKLPIFLTAVNNNDERTSARVQIEASTHTVMIHFGLPHHASIPKWHRE